MDDKVEDIVDVVQKIQFKHTLSRSFIFKSKSDHWLDEVRRLRCGGVGAMGLRGGVAPLDLMDPVGVDVRLLGRNLIEEYGEAPLDIDILAYRMTPRSRCPASMA